MKRDNYYSIYLPLVNKIECEDSQGPILISSQDHMSVRKAIYLFAKFFQREFKYDFVQYNEFGEDDDTCHAYIWTIHDGFNRMITGACCFRERNYTNYPLTWGLQWVWFHPFFRGKGLLSAAWGKFEEKYGIDFHVEPPLSSAMKGFLKDRNYKAHTEGLHDKKIDI